MEWAEGGDPYGEKAVFAGFGARMEEEEEEEEDEDEEILESAAETEVRFPKAAETADA